MIKLENRLDKKELNQESTNELKPLPIHFLEKSLEKGKTIDIPSIGVEISYDENLSLQVTYSKK